MLENVNAINHATKLHLLRTSSLKWVNGHLLTGLP